jgi:isoamylase
MGDEVQRTQKGNNNAYCQDNELSWFDWSFTKKNAGLLRFTRGLISFAQSRSLFSEERFLANTENRKCPYLVRHGVQLNKPDWNWDSHTLAFTLIHPKMDEQLHVILNSYWEALQFELPKLSRKRKWCRIIDTSLDSPADFSEIEQATRIAEKRYLVQPRTVVVLFS